MDSGVNDITGNVLKLEGHVQNEIVYSEASQSLTISKFGKLKSSLLLQYIKRFKSIRAIMRCPMRIHSFQVYPLITDMILSL